MADLKNSEQLIYFMIHNLRLSRYDNRFLQNLEKLINNTHRVTTNQVDLVNKLISKYERQLIKHELFIKDLLELPWKTLIVQTTEEFTSAHIGILDDNIILKTPYNKQFINAFRSVNEDCFIWDPINKYYIGILSTYSLKLAINTTTRFFKEVRYSDTVKKLLDKLTPYEDATYWSPTLVCCNGNYMIACINESLHNALSNIQLNTELTTLAELARYGIDVDDSILISNEERFASQFNPEVEILNMNDMIPWLKNIQCDYVYVSGAGLSSITGIKTDFRQKLAETGIQYADSTKYQRANFSNYKFPVAIRFRLIPDFNEPNNVAKIITIVNSQPVNLEKNETM